MSKQHDKKHHSESSEKITPFPNETNAAGANDGSAEASKEQAKEAEPSDAAIELKARIASLEAENSSLKDQYLRKAAEFENFRKRMNKDKQDAIDFANQSLLLDLIPVIDDFERAIKSSEGSRDFNTLHEGVAIIEKRLVSQLESKWGLVRFESMGCAFDPNRHEGIMMEKSSDVSEPTVSEDFVRGYTLKDRVIRSAKVKVMMPADEVSQNDAPAGGDDSSSVTNDAQN